MKLFCLALLTVAGLSAQTLGTLTDAPQHFIGAGVGVSTPTPLQTAGFLAYGEKITGATYSFTRADFNVAKNGTFTTTTTTGVKQIVYQGGRLSLALDGTVGVAAGASSATSGASTAAFAYGGAGDLFVRLNKTANLTAGSGNNYVIVGAGVVGTTQGNGVVFRIGFGHSIN